VVEFWMDTAQRVDLYVEGPTYLLKAVPVLNDPQEIRLRDTVPSPGKPTLAFANNVQSGLWRDSATDRVVMSATGSEVTSWVRDATIPDFDAKTFVVNNPGYTTGGQHTLVVSRTDHAGPLGHVMADLQYVTRAVKGPSDPHMTDSSVARIWGTVADGDSQIRAIEAQVIRLAGANNATTAADFNTVNGYPPDTGELLDDRTTTGLKVSQHAGLAAPPPATLSTSLTGLNNDLTYRARQGGVDSNSISLAYVDPSVETPTESVSVVGQAIMVTLRRVSGLLSTAAQVKAAIEANQAANDLVCVMLKSPDDGTGPVTAMPTTNLAGGSDQGRASGCTSYLQDVTVNDARKNHGTALMLWGDMGWASYLRCYGPDMGSPAVPGNDLRFEIEGTGEIATLAGIRFRDPWLTDSWKTFLDSGSVEKTYRLAALGTGLDKLQIDWAANGNLRLLPAAGGGARNSGKLLVGGPTPSFQVDTATDGAAVKGGLAVGFIDTPSWSLHVKEPAGDDVNVCVDTTAQHSAAVRFQETGTDQWVLLRDSINRFTLFDPIAGMPAISVTPGSAPHLGTLSIMPDPSASVGLGTTASTAYVLWVDATHRDIRLEVATGNASQESPTGFFQLNINGTPRLIPYY
jgi:hypothetical protein